MDFEPAKRNFYLDPNYMNAKNLINLMKRSSMSLPSSAEEIIKFFGRDSVIIKEYISAMDYGKPSWVAFIMLNSGILSLEEVQKIIENDEVSDARSTAHTLFKSR